MCVSGPSPFSELESQAIRDYSRSLLANNNLTAFYTLHSFGQQWAYAYSWSPDPVPEDAELVGTSRITMVYLLDHWNVCSVNGVDCQDSLCLHIVHCTNFPPIVSILNLHGRSLLWLSISLLTYLQYSVAEVGVNALRGRFNTPYVIGSVFNVICKLL